MKIGPLSVGSYYIEGYMHWNSAGNALVADEIFRQFDPLKACSHRAGNLSK
jgi:hypothetical protein